MSPRARTLAIGLTRFCAALTVALILGCIWTSGALSTRLGVSSMVALVLAILGMGLIGDAERSS